MPVMRCDLVQRWNWSAWILLMNWNRFQLRWQVFRIDFTTCDHDSQPATGVLKLTHITLPWQFLHIFLSFRTQNLWIDPKFLSGTRQKMLRQHRNIFTAMCQFWNMNTNYIQSMIQVFTETTIMNQFFQILMCCCHDTHIDLNRNVTANTVKLTIRQNA